MMVLKMRCGVVNHEFMMEGEEDMGLSVGERRTTVE